MPIQKLKTISTFSFLRTARQVVAQFRQTVQQWKYPARLRDSFLEWNQEIRVWLQAPDRAKRRVSSSRNAPSLQKLAPISLQKIRRFPRPPQPVRLAALGILLIIGPLALGSILFPSKPAAWYNSSWNHRKSITVTNGSGGTLTDYQVWFDIDTASLISTSKMQGDCDDLRVTANDGTTILDHWVETGGNGCNTATTKVWVKLSSLTTSGDTLYVYYANAAASNTENGTSVFEVFDDFSGSSLNSSLWQKRNGNTPSFSGGIMSMTANGVDPGKFIAISAPTGDNYAMRARLSSTAGSGTDERMGVGIKTGTGDGRGYNYVYRDFTNFDEIKFLNDGSAWGGGNFGSWSSNTYAILEIYQNGSTVYGRHNDGSWNSQAWSGRTGYPSLNFGSGNAQSQWDWAVVRKITTTEPTTSVGSEENAPTGGGPWYNSSWLYRKSITIDEAQVAGSSDHTDFPMLVSITDTDLLANAQTDADDIVFTATDHSTKLDHEIESYDSGTGTLVAWVRIPSLSATVDTEIFMYYGNAGASNQENVTGVWDTNYKGVWHLAENPGGSAPQVQDSTTNNLDGTSVGSMTSGDLVTGKLNGGYDFDGSDDGINLGSNALLKFGTGNFIYSAWVKTSATGATDIYISESNNATAERMLYLAGANKPACFARDASGNSAVATGTTSITDNQWYYLTCVRNGTSTHIYVNGQLEATGTNGSLGNTNTSPSANVYIAKRDNAAGLNMAGLIDEVRISSAVRSTDWITTEYNNQNSPGTFYTLGAQEEPSSGEDSDWYDSAWEYRRAIPVTNNVSTESNVYISFDGGYLLDTSAAGKFQDDCGDIRFTTENGTLLDYTINSGCGTSSTDIDVFFPSFVAGAQTIYIYYGNSGASDGFSSPTLGSPTTSYLTSGTTWNVPSDWNSANNSIEAIGAGGNGAISVASTRSGGGGGGGEYRRAENVTLTPSSTVNINIPGGGAGSGATGTRLQNNSSTTVLEAKNGGNASGVTAGAGGSGGTGAAANYNGGAGGTGASNSVASGAGGGGSAGPSGVGRNGANGTGGANNAAGGGGGSNGGSSTAGSTNSGQTGGAGGHGTSGSGGGSGGTNNNNNAGNGSNGGGGGGSGTAGSTNGGKGGDGSAQSLWDTGVGPSGGGGGGAGANGTGATGDKDGGNGGAYGGGAGGCGISGTMQAGECDGSATAGQGLLVITYTPLVSPFSTEATNYTIGTVGSEETEPMPSPEPENLANTLGASGSNPVANLLAYWAFDEQQGQIINSRANGTTYNGTLGANSSSSTDDPTWKTAATCTVNGCLEFDGTTDFVAAVGNEENQFTISMWIKPDAVTSRGIAGMAEVPGSSTHDRDLYFDANSKIAGKIFDGSDKFVRSTTTAVAGNWYHIAMMYDGTNLTLWINGRRESTTSASNPYSGYTTPEYVIGRTYTGMGGSDATISNPFYDGLIDEVQFFSSALTEEQLSVIINANSAVNFSTGSNEAALISGGSGNPPVLHWTYDENTGSTANDTSGNARSGTITGATWAPGKLGSGLSYDGNDHVRSANNALDSLSSQGSFTFWFKTGSTTESLMVSNEGYHAVYMNFNNVAGRIAAFFDGSSGGNPSTTLSYNDNNWHHLAAINNGSTTKVYVDGVKVLDFAESFAAPSSTQPFAVGSQYTGAGSFFTGSLDNIKAFNYALSEAQIQYDYNRGGPSAWYKLDECTGTTAYDSSGFGNNGTISIGGSGTYTAAGTCTSGTSTHAWNAGSTGKQNASLGFDGTNDVITISSNAAFQPPGEVTAMAWIKPGSLSGTYKTILSTDAYELFVHNGRLTTYLNTTTGTQLDGTTNLVLNQWHHVAVTYSQSAGTMQIYLDGELEGTTSKTGALSGYSSLTIGQDHSESGRYLNAIIDDVRIYSYAQTLTQIQQAMNQGTVFFGPDTGSP